MARNSLIVAGLAIGIAALALTVISATENQKAFETPTALQPSAEGTIHLSDSPLSPMINKEQWHDDPGAERAAEIKEKFYSGT